MNAATDPSKPFQTLALFGRFNTPNIAITLAEIKLFAERRGLTVLTPPSDTGKPESSAFDDERPALRAQFAQQADLAVVVGGDGTMLGIARELAPFDVPLVGINHGRLGFMTDVPLGLWGETLDAILHGKFETEYRSLLTVQVMRQGKAVFAAPALNDVVVSRGTGGRMVEVQVDVNGTYMYSQRADGLIVSTPTGSTAYALSANGPILHPGLAGLVLVPVAPQALSNRPIVLPDSAKITIRVADAVDARVNCDMQTFADLQEGDQILIERAAHSIRFLHPIGYSYYATLRQKLHWHAMPAMVDRSGSGLV
jgi:NAD+ kinase